MAETAMIIFKNQIKISWLKKKRLFASSMGEEINLHGSVKMAIVNVSPLSICTKEVLYLVLVAIRCKTVRVCKCCGSGE